MPDNLDDLTDEALGRLSGGGLYIAQQSYDVWNSTQRQATGRPSVHELCLQYESPVYKVSLAGSLQLTRET